MRPLPKTLVIACVGVPNWSLTGHRWEQCKGGHAKEPSIGFTKVHRDSHGFKARFPSSYDAHGFTVKHHAD